MAVCGGDGAAVATKWGKWNTDMGIVERRFREPLSLRPRASLSAWAQPPTGTPDAEDGRGRSSGRGCEAHAAPSPAPLRSALAPGDWSVDSPVGASHPAHPASGRLMGQVLRSSVSGRDVGHNYL